MEIKTFTYEETVELEKMVEIKNQAEKIMKDFTSYVFLKMSDYKGDGKFVIWKDSNNATYFVFDKDQFSFVADFLHENYVVKMTVEEIFNLIKTNYKGLPHLEEAIRRYKLNGSTK